MGCNYLSLPLIFAFGTSVLNFEESGFHCREQCYPSRSTEAYTCPWTVSSLAHVIYHLFGAKPLPMPFFSVTDINTWIIQNKFQYNLNQYAKCCFKMMLLKMSFAKCPSLCHGPLFPKQTVLPRILVITATNRNGQNRNGHKPKWPQTETATDRNGHRPERPQTETATNRNGHRPERPQTETATNRNRHSYIWFSGLQICVLNRRFKLVSRSCQK